MVDLGGTPYFWNLLDGGFEVTLVNLPGSEMTGAHLENFTLIQGDACDLRGVFADGAFDFVFSNSVIEHVGDESRQEAFAREVRRLAPAYWVQTPSDRFPLEVHTGIPYYWRLPESTRRWLHRRWERDLPAWFEMIRETRVLSRKRMQELFPDSQMYIERWMGVEKSYSAYRAAAVPAAAPKALNVA